MINIIEPKVRAEYKYDVSYDSWAHFVKGTEPELDFIYKYLSLSERIKFLRYLNSEMSYKDAKEISDHFVRYVPLPEVKETKVKDNVYLLVRYNTDAMSIIIGPFANAQEACAYGNKYFIEDVNWSYHYLRSPIIEKENVK